MAQTKDLGRAFAQVIDVQPGTPIFHRWQTVETDEPFRHSPRSLIVRLWPTCKAIVLGWWQDTEWTEEEALGQALDVTAYNVYADLDGLDLEDAQVRQTIRENIADQAQGLGMEIDDEWEILSALGVAH